ncbi:hypothetical protein [Pseudoclavibacter sp. JSM 162008]|uniref:hypothetical protein n=1 Tax=Pseudoclavibacter sp. JSM 162008 TaxID=3229855 RepID=UPI003523DEB8
MSRTKIVASAFAATALICFGSAMPANAATVASMPGPITALTTTPDLTCNANVAGGSDGPHFQLGASCLTAVVAGGTLNRPADYPLPGYPDAEVLLQDWSPIAQETSGSGTLFDPFVISTVVAGDQIQVTQVDTYASGSSSFTSSVEVENVGSVALEPIVYRVSDCARAEYDVLSYAAAPTGDGSVACNSMQGIPTGQWGEGTTAGDDLAQLVPITQGSKFEVDQGRGIGAHIALEAEFNNTALTLGGARDNFIGLSWKLDLAPGASSKVAFQTHFSTEDQRAVPTALTLMDGEGGEKTVTASFGTEEVPTALSGSPLVRLPAGISYVPGSSTIGEPMVVGDVLMFTAPVGSTGTSFSFRIGGGESGASGDLKLAGSTMDGVDFVQTTVPIEIAPFTPEPTSTPSATLTPSQPPTVAPTATASVSPTASTTAPPAASTQATATPAATPAPGALATTGADGNLAPLGIGAGIVLLLGVGVTALALRRRIGREHS